MGARVVILTLALLVFWAGSLQVAGAQEGASRQEVINEVSRVTGLSSDIIAQTLGDNPAWMQKLGSAVTAAQLIDKLLQGKDSEVVVDLVTGTATGAADTFVSKALPPPVAAFIAAVKAYKASLELIRDYAFVPALNAAVYGEYKRARGGRLDYSYASPEEAFEQAIYNLQRANGGLSFKGYWPQYEAQYQTFLKAKDYNPDLVGKRLEEHLKGKLDDFWTGRMEVTYQREILAGQKQSLIDAVWASVQGILDQLAAPAGINTSLFLDPASDLPAGWWWVQDGREAFTETPVANQTSGSPYDIWRQSFTMSTGKGFSVNKNGSWCKPGSGATQDCDFPYMNVRVFIMVAKPEKDAGYSLSVQDILDYDVSNNGYTSLSAGAAWRMVDDNLDLEFVVGKYLGKVSMRAPKGPQASLEIAKPLARVIAQKLKQQTVGAKPQSRN
ncbi:hypothetical protein [Roseibium sp.]|uniref:hypothetical protein n=1 Tax=Roseibium sp. TaxID=1936156 RepID=UPI003A9759A8